MKTLFTLMILLATTTVAFGQEANYMELMRQDVRAEKVAIITEAMQFTDEQAEAFWPIYREYEVELAKIYDGTAALIKDYAANFDAMTGEKADELVKNSFKLDSQESKLLKNYYSKFKKAVDPITAAKFVQVENRIGWLINLQIASALPLVESTKETEAAGW